MYGTDVVIESSCRRCGAEVAVHTVEQGTVMAEGRPNGAMVWYDLAYWMRSDG
jgi:hypothetical protein